MQPNPFSALVKSRKFWVMILDLVVSLTTFFVAKYASPDAQEITKFVILAVQPVFLVVIGSIAAEDISLNVANARKYEAELLWAREDVKPDPDSEG